MTVESKLLNGQDKATENSKLQRELSAVLNRASRENLSNTPDFILAEYLLNCLEAFELATRARVRWHGEDSMMTTGGPSVDAPSTTGGPLK